MKHELIFVPVNERLPDKTDWYIFRSLPDGLQVKRILFNPELDGKGWILQHFTGTPKIEWLEEQQGVIVFTLQELKKLFYLYNLGSIQNAGEFLKSKGYE